MGHKLTRLQVWTRFRRKIILSSQRSSSFYKAKPVCSWELEALSLSRLN